MPPVYVLDSCVLYPVVIRDLLLTLATLDAFEPRWTEAILDEMMRNVLDDHPTIDPAHFEAGSVGAMRRAFPAAPVEGYEHLIGDMDNHRKDRHVAAAALHIGAATVVTYNVRDFDSELLRQRGIAIITPPQLVGAGDRSGYRRERRSTGAAAGLSDGRDDCLSSSGAVPCWAFIGLPSRSRRLG